MARSALLFSFGANHLHRLTTPCCSKPVSRWHALEQSIPNHMTTWLETAQPDSSVMERTEGEKDIQAGSYLQYSERTHAGMHTKRDRQTDRHDKHHSEPKQHHSINASQSLGCQPPHLLWRPWTHTQLLTSSHCAHHEGDTRVCHTVATPPLVTHRCL